MQLKPVQNFNEALEYDDMNRLTGSEFKINNYSHPENDFVIEYDNYGFGNMVSKSDVGDFRYGEEIGGITAGPHALTRIDNLVDYMPPNQNISYTSFNKVATIEEILPNDYVQFLEIDYGVDDQRRQSVYTLNDSVIKTKYFFGDYEEIEEDGITMAYHFIHSPTGLCAVYETEKEALTDTVPSILWHINTDHLGSIAFMVDASNSSSTKEYSFTAWGLSRDPGDWSEINTEPLYADRGFTGHEHLSEFNLINMNGRVYDPITARFLSPDPYVQMPGMRSGFNRYSYCLNNPLVYTDPDGEIIFTTIATLVPGLQPFIPVAMALDYGIRFGIDYASAKSRGLSTGQSLLYAGVNAGIGLATQSIGVPGIIPNAALHAGMNVTGNGVSNTILGEPFFENWGPSAIAGGISGGLSGYSMSKDQGLNYWWGTSEESWGYNRGQWSIAWWDKPDIVDFNLDNYGPGEINCFAKCLNYKYGLTEEYWDDYSNSGDEYFFMLHMQSEGNLPRSQYYNSKIDPKKHGFKYFQDLANRDGFAMLTYEQYGPTAGGHATAISKIKFVPGKRFDVFVWDPYDGQTQILKNFPNNLQGAGARILEILCIK